MSSNPKYGLSWEREWERAKEALPASAAMMANQTLRYRTPTMTAKSFPLQGKEVFERIDFKL